ncbi:MAG TPA: IS1634 family transposase [Flavobacterium sp.]|uniref:IS1634 family transposase n=1 Tax=Flavobacterium sp. TaxID=239 RepID=UPI002F3F47F6
MAKTRIKRGNKVYVYERENYRDEFGKVKHRKAQYLGIEETIDGKTRIIPPKKRQKDIEITSSVRYGDIATLYTLLKKYNIIDTLNDLIPRRGLPVGEVLTTLAVNHIVNRETLNMLSKWYQDTALEDFIKIPSDKLNSTNLGAVMGTVKKLVPEGIVDVCIKLFDKIKHLETGSTSLLYDITSTYFYSTKLPKARYGHNRDENNQPQINISLVATKDKGLPIFFRTYEGNITDVTTIKQMILDVKRIDFNIDALILDRGMASKTNLKALAGNQIKIIGGIPLTSNEAKELVECDISEENELIRPSGLIYYEDKPETLFGIKGRAIVCFNHTDLEHERSLRLKKIAVAEKRIAEIFNSHECNENLSCLENEIKAAIKGVSDYFIVTNDDGKVSVSPNVDNRKKAKLRDGKCLIFTTDFEKNAPEVISLYFEKDIIEKIFNCFKSWLDLQPVRHFDEGHIDVYVFVCYLAYLTLALYKHHLGTNGWEGVKESLDELGRIRKTTLTLGGEKIDKITVLTKEQKEIIEKLDLKDKLFLGCSL